MDIRNTAIACAASLGRNDFIFAGATALATPVKEAVDTLKAACTSPSTDKKAVFRALRTVQAEKLKV
jgi:hypothetical protein